jgi:hypothetical protein
MASVTLCSKKSVSFINSVLCRLCSLKSFSISDSIVDFNFYCVEQVITNSNETSNFLYGPYVQLHKILFVLFPLVRRLVAEIEFVLYKTLLIRCHHILHCLTESFSLYLPGKETVRCIFCAESDSSEAELSTL